MTTEDSKQLIDDDGAVPDLVTKLQAGRIVKDYVKYVGLTNGGEYRVPCTYIELNGAMQLQIGDVVIITEPTV